MLPAALRRLSTCVHSPHPLPPHFGVSVLPDFLSPAEEALLDAFCAPLLHRRAWEKDHFDSVISHFRETQVALARLCPAGAAAIARAHAAFPPPGGGVGLPMDTLHALELSPTAGAIGPHVDSIKFSGAVVAGLCLRSEAVMQLTVDEGALEGGRAPTAAAWAAGGLPLQEQRVTVLLPRRCLYVLTGEARYGWAHALPLRGEWQGRAVHRAARGRLSIILRDALPAAASPQP